VVVFVVRDGKPVESLPPSAKLIYKILEYKGELTQKEIVEESMLPVRTVRYAIRRLKDSGIIVERFNFKDARQTIYSLRTHKGECYDH
jgi:DNA-binding MarR family transcriptional regulator